MTAGPSKAPYCACVRLRWMLASNAEKDTMVSDEFPGRVRFR